MINIENVEVTGWEAAIRWMRKPMNSCEKSDSYDLGKDPIKDNIPHIRNTFQIGPNDYDLMKRLCNAGTEQRKFMQMITVSMHITAPLYWWKEFDTRTVCTGANSCLTKHKFYEKAFTLEDFSTEHLIDSSLITLEETVNVLNDFRQWYLKWDHMQEKDKSFFDQGINCKKDLWWQIFQLLPISYNQRRIVMLTYEVLTNIYRSLSDHKFDEWCLHKEVIRNVDSTSQAKYAKPYKERIGFCDWIETLPYSELITGVCES